MQVEGKAWGKTHALFNKNNVEVHLIKVNRFGYCSLHCHHNKYNVFFVSIGKLKITQVVDDKEDVTLLKAGDEISIAPGVYHQFEALEYTEALEVYYVQLTEDDIHRINQGGMRDAKETDFGCENPGRGAEENGRPGYRPAWQYSPDRPYPPQPKTGDIVWGCSGSFLSTPEDCVRQKHIKR